MSPSKVQCAGSCGNKFNEKSSLRSGYCKTCIGRREKEHHVGSGGLGRDPESSRGGVGEVRDKQEQEGGGMVSPPRTGGASRTFGGSQEQRASSSAASTPIKECSPAARYETRVPLWDDDTTRILLSCVERETPIGVSPTLFVQRDSQGTAKNRDLWVDVAKGVAQAQPGFAPNPEQCARKVYALYMSACKIVPTRELAGGEAAFYKVLQRYDEKVQAASDEQVSVRILKQRNKRMLDLLTYLGQLAENPGTYNDVGRRILKFLDKRQAAGAPLGETVCVCCLHVSICCIFLSIYFFVRFLS